jgi:hypothetical protein
VANPEPRGSYAEYLRSPWWRERRREAGEAVGWRCPCGAQATQVHHRTYERLGNESAPDLHPLCGDCHAKIHRWVSDEGMELADATDAVVYGVEPVSDTKRARLSRRRRRKSKSRRRRAPASNGPAGAPGGSSGSTRSSRRA